MAKINQKKELGKGISALLGNIKNDINKPANLEETMGVSTKPAATNHLPIDQIEVNPFQPRDNFDEEALNRLKESIEIHGVIQPLTVRKSPNNNKFQLISGERRLRASKLAGLQEVPVFIREVNDQESLEMALLENIQREDLNPIEIATNYQRLIEECSLTQDTLAERLAQKRSSVTNYLRLLKLPPEVQIAVREETITMGHAKVLAGIEEIELQLIAFREITQRNLSVRQTEDFVAQLKNKLPKKSKDISSKSNLDPILGKWQTQLSQTLGTKVQIQTKNGKNGQILIPFYSEEDMQRLVELIEKS
ncbi:MAG: ParB/RepB/Spo0J family partition protein [Chitinophagales bacterium]|jgi:ParB family chromosome partitioning protein|nr:ParB/RepB/Spo0J family partition protein [Chitinophagales bacterium]